MNQRIYRVLLVSLYIITGIICLYFVHRGMNYYLTPLHERPRHIDHMILKPGGDISHGLGIVGSTMVLTMLLYSVRKRSPWFAQAGPISRWLDIHIYFGIFAPLFIILHSSFKVYGLVAISFYSMVAVALSGIIGRYLYMQIPRNIRGHELSLKEMTSLNKQLSEQLIKQYNVSDDMIEQIERITSAENLQSKNFLLFFWNMFRHDVDRSIQLRRFSRQFIKTNALSKKEMKSLTSLARQKASLVRKIVILDRVQQLFHYWHVIHKPFAIIMIIIMFVHVAVAVAFGYTWIF